VPATPPAALGRGVVVTAGRSAGGIVPAPWHGAQVVTIDEPVLADPAAAVGALHEAWATRSPVVIELAVDPARFRTAPSIEVDEPWRLDPGLELWHDRLHFLVWANTYDGRSGGVVWWWGRKAARLGAVERAADHGPGDVTLPDGEPAWIDGGPRGGLRAGHLPAGERAAVVHAESVEAGSLAPVPLDPPAPGADLAPDQLAAVAHGAGPARVIAPAGSGKTRVLTERLRHLLVDRGYEPGGVVAVAYNRKAREEMVSRTTGIGARILTLNALGYELVAIGLGRRPDVIDVRDTRRLLEPLVPSPRRQLNTDPLGPYIEALGQVRLGLCDPAEVEAARSDVPGLAEAFPRYRAELARRGVIDFDEQVILAIELLLRDGELRRAQQARHRHLLVDEFQDLTPAHVLLVRLLAAPRFDVFGVGDDDQVIYGHAGASPAFLTGFGRFFPGAHEHALEVNYRCPAPVVAGARNLLTRNTLRVPKQIRTPEGDVASAGAFAVHRHLPQAGAHQLVDIVRGWLAEPSIEPSDVAVLARVGSLLLAPHVALVEAGVPVADAVLRPDVLVRTGLRAALAYLRIAAEPERIDPRDLVEVHRRPSRGLPGWIDKWLGRCTDVDDIERAAARIDDDKVSTRLSELAGDLAELAALARSGTTRAVLEHVRDGIGLGRAMEQLDTSGGNEGQSHGDDLDALIQVADLHPDPGGFEPWLRGVLARPEDPGGVALSTVHRVKGREWPRVALFGAADGLMPHRLSPGRLALEEERRVFHVAVTRGIGKVAVLADATRPSPFLAELDAPATEAELVTADQARRREEAGGHRRAAAHGAGPARPRAAPPAAEGPPPDPAVEASLRDWRSARSKADGVPAYVVLSNRQLAGIAGRCPTDLDALARCPGIGPKRLEAYGHELVERVREALDAS
jgi:DNA helicase II / ATP-dependent DNA helicase PcrA